MFRSIIVENGGGGGRAAMYYKAMVMALFQKLRIVSNTEMIEYDRFLARLDLSTMTF